MASIPAKSFPRKPASSKELTYVLGYDPSNPCSFPDGQSGASGAARKAREKIQKYEEDIRQEVKDTITRLMSDGLGKNFFAGAFALLGNFATAGIVGIFETARAMATGAVYGTLNTVLGLAINSVPGMDVMLKYLAVQALKNELEGRLTLSTKLLAEINLLIEVLNNTLSTPYKTPAQVGSVSDALRFVKNAQVLLGKEISKQALAESLDVSVAIDSDNIKIIDDQIAKAINTVTFSATERIYEYEQAINRVNQRYGLKTRFDRNAPIVGAQLPYLGTVGVGYSDFTKDPTAYFALYAKMINDEVQSNRDMTVNGVPTSKGLRWLNEFLNIAGLPNILKVFILGSRAKAPMKALVDRFPLDSGTALGFLDQLFADGAVNETKDWIWDLVGPSRPINRYERGENYLSWSGTVNLTEGIVLSTPAWSVNFKYKFGKVANALVPAKNSLDQTANSMELELAFPTETSRKLTQQRLDWQSWLSEARVSLSKAKDLGVDRIGGLNQPYSIADIERKFTQALLTYADLTQFITDKVVDPITGEAKQKTSDQLLDLVNKTLGILNVGAYVTLDQKRTRSLVAALQGTRVLLQKAISEDSAELALCNQFIDEVNRVPFFGNVIQPAWNNLERMLEDPLPPLLQPFEKIIRRGNLGAMLGILDNADDALVSTASGLSAVAKCIGLNSVGGAFDKFAKMAVETWSNVDLNPEELKEWQAKVSKSMNKLKDKARVLELLQKELI